jgi:hypothetical protein
MEKRILSLEVFISSVSTAPALKRQKTQSDVFWLIWSEDQAFATQMQL